jgi:hypothetical protein
MSRTDKDAPFWVQDTYYEPSHWNCEFSLTNRGQRVCDLPAAPVRHNGYYKLGYGHCTWEPCWDSWPDRSYNKDRPDGRIHRKRNYWGPDRSRSQNQLREAAKEYHGAGDVDSDEYAQQHRHSPIAGGYW